MTAHFPVAAAPAHPFRLRLAADCLRQGQVIAYPTEAVYGLGCDPFDEQALEGLLQLKRRSWRQGLILIASEPAQLAPVLGEVPDALWQRVLPDWPGPHTWILPAAAGLSPLLIGERDSIAVRVTAHPQAAALCRAFGGAIVSTSANLSGRPPARSALAVRRQFGQRLGLILAGEVDQRARPSTIRDGVTGRVLRS